MINFQADAFLNYASKFKLKDKNEMLSLFEKWATSKDLLEDDKKKILKLVEQHFLSEQKNKKR